MLSGAFNLNRYIHENKNEKSLFNIVKPVLCKDGFTISVQASKRHYCTPREDDVTWYTEVECGFPNNIPEFIMEYAEDPENPLNTVYPHVPVELVEKLIEFHGGLDERID